jgi:hypothetical protein
MSVTGAIQKEKSLAGGLDRSIEKDNPGRKAVD